jgi:hypothetical protein
VYDRGNFGVPGEGEWKRKKSDGEIQMWERENRYSAEGEERRCRMCYKERKTIEHIWNRCDEMRARERKKWGGILNEDGREIGWMKEICNRRDTIEKERG